MYCYMSGNGDPYSRFVPSRFELSNSTVMLSSLIFGSTPSPETVFCDCAAMVVPRYLKVLRFDVGYGAGGGLRAGADQAASLTYSVNCFLCVRPGSHHSRLHEYSVVLPHLQLALEASQVRIAKRIVATYPPIMIMCTHFPLLR